MLSALTLSLVDELGQDFHEQVDTVSTKDTEDCALENYRHFLIARLRPFGYYRFALVTQL